MKIVGRLLILLVAALGVAGAAVMGCGTTNNINSGQGTSDVGQSCTRTFDCKSGLICEQNVCYMPAGTTVGDGGVVVGDGGDASILVPTGPHLGALNESCQTTSDCESPLECLGLRCSVVNYGLTATGKSCAECKTAADCCELPVGFAPDLDYELLTDAGFYAGEQELFTGNVRCQDLLGFIGGDPTICGSAATLPPVQAGLASACFYYNAYCGSCGASGPWACTAAGSCVYMGACTATGTSAATAAAACPSETRLGHALSPTCNSTDGGATGACAAGCVLDSDCAGKTPAGTGHACSTADAGNGDCSCNAGACYFTCKSDLDCAAGKTCDTTGTHLCKTTGCTTDSDCIQSLGNAMGKCMTGTCNIACTKDTDCNNPPSTICSAGFCMASGCTSDVDCTSGNAHSFCVTAPATATTYSSAVTN